MVILPALKEQGFLTRTLVKKAYKSSRWNIQVEISDNNTVSVDINK